MSGNTELHQIKSFLGVDLTHSMRHPHTKKNSTNINSIPPNAGKYLFTTTYYYDSKRVFFFFKVRKKRKSKLMKKLIQEFNPPSAQRERGVCEPKESRQYTTRVEYHSEIRAGRERGGGKGMCA